MARAKYLVEARPELLFASKDVCRWGRAPTETSLNALERLGRYLERKAHLLYKYP